MYEEGVQQHSLGGLLRCGCHLIQQWCHFPVSQSWRIARHNPAQTEARKTPTSAWQVEKLWIIVYPMSWVFPMREKDFKIKMRYLQWLFYRALYFFSHVKRPSKAFKELRILRKWQVLKNTPQCSNLITDPEKGEEEENDGYTEGTYDNEELLTRVLAVRLRRGGAPCITWLKDENEFCNLLLNAMYRYQSDSFRTPCTTQLEKMELFCKFSAYLHIWMNGRFFFWRSWDYDNEKNRNIPFISSQIHLFVFDSPS